MFLILRISQGPHAGVSRSLMTGQRALVGCSNWAHFAVDSCAMGDPQFLLKLGLIEATVENLSESAMLFVNGQKCSRRKLSNGDIISVGDCEFLVEIRGVAWHLSHLDLPLVGSLRLSEEFARSVRLSRTIEGLTGGSRITIHPEFWSESVRLRNQGTGIPSLQMLRNISRKRPCGLIVNSRIQNDVSRMLGVAEYSFLPIVSRQSPIALLWLLDSVPLQAIHDVITAYWSTRDVLFFVPVDFTLRYRNRVLDSTLWNNRTVDQVTTLLMMGTISVRESAFRFLDAALLPTQAPDNGWILLTTVKVETQTDSKKPA